MHERRVIDRKLRKTKLEELAEEYGTDVEGLLEAAVLDDVVPGICTNVGCNHTAENEPDQDAGWCEDCESTTVASALILAQMI